MRDFYIKLDSENERYRLMEKDAIQTEEFGKEDAVVADIYDMEAFNEFLAQPKE